MKEFKNLIIDGEKLDLSLLEELQEKPAPFAPGEPLFWDDPHISGQMLATHLDPETDLASRRPETIDKSVAWIMDVLDLQTDDHLLDLGCGPGLYANRFAQLGIRVTGVDTSKRSITYAQKYAEMLGLEISYRYQNYLELEDQEMYDAAVLIFGDYCALNPQERRQLLENVGRAMKPGGYFVLDVSTPHLADHQGEKSGWYSCEAGFWRPHSHLVLENGFAYPEELIYLDQYIVIEGNGSIMLYRNWFQDFDRESIEGELRAGGFDILGIWGDLTGEPYTPEGEWIGVVAKKCGE